MSDNGISALCPLILSVSLNTFRFQPVLSVAYSDPVRSKILGLYPDPEFY
jgi:hypothetical protein